MKQSIFDKDSILFNFSCSQENYYQTNIKEYSSIRDLSKGMNNIQVCFPQKTNYNLKNEGKHFNTKSDIYKESTDISSINSRKELQRDDIFLYLKQEILELFTENQNFFINKCKELLTEDLYKYFNNKFDKFCKIEDVQKLLDIQKFSNLYSSKRLEEDNLNLNEINKIKEFNQNVEKELYNINNKIENIDKKINFLEAIEFKINNLFSEIEKIKTDMEIKEYVAKSKNSPNQVFSSKNECRNVEEISKSKNIADSLICIKEEFLPINNNKSEFHSEIYDNNNLLSNLYDKIYLIEAQGNKCSEEVIQIQNQYEQLINEMKNVRHIIFTNQSFLNQGNVKYLFQSDKKLLIKKIQALIA